MKCGSRWKSKATQSPSAAVMYWPVDGKMVETCEGLGGIGERRAGGLEGWRGRAVGLMMQMRRCS